jgi:DNA-binding winged helix-turn-helix (wHTH) protein/Tol biopolymer transport system component
MVSKSFVFRFDDVEVREREFTVIKAGKVSTVEPKAFRALLFLLRNPRRLISKEEVLNSVWGEVAVADGSLTRCIWLLRRVLEDDINQPRYIETVPTVGYRFMCPVEVLEETHGGNGGETEQHEVEAADVPAEPGSRRTFRRWMRPRAILAVGLVGILLAVAVFAILRFYPRVQPFNSISIEQITEDGDITNIAMSPDGNTLAEVKSQGGQHSIWVRNISTGRDIQILPPVFLDYGSLVFSRDGNELYFVRGGEDNSKSFSLYSLSVFGGEPRLIIRNVERAISLSPDQRHLAYEKNTDGAGEMHIDRLEGGDDNIVAKATGRDLSSPVWSPNGRSLAWVIRKDDPAHPPGPPGITIFEINSKKQREMSLPSNISGVYDLDWLPSGKQLLLLFGRSYTGFAAGDQIGLMSIDSGDFRPLTNDLISHSGITIPTDGKVIATLLQQRSSEIGFYDSAGAKLISTTRLPGEPHSLVWLDEDTLLTKDPSLTTIRRDNAEIKELELVFPPGNREVGFSWSNSSNTSPAVCPDGDIVLTGEVDGTNQIYLVDSHGHFVRTLVKVQGSGMFCSQENKLAYYSAADPKDPSIWSVSLAGGAPRKVMSIPHAAAIVYSVNGKTAAYVLDNGAGSTATIMNLDQRKVVREFSIANHVHETLPHFTPDGSALAFIEQQKQGFALASQPMSGSEPRILTTWFKDPIKDFGWSPSGKTLVIMWDRSTSDVALITDKSAKPRD